jgi:hypothetical protein
VKTGNIDFFNGLLTYIMKFNPGTIRITIFPLSRIPSIARQREGAAQQPDNTFPKRATQREARLLKQLQELSAIAACMALLLLSAGCSTAPTIDGTGDKTMSGNGPAAIREKLDGKTAIEVIGMAWEISRQ